MKYTIICYTYYTILTILYYNIVYYSIAYYDILQYQDKIKDVNKDGFKTAEMVHPIGGAGSTGQSDQTTVTRWTASTQMQTSTFVYVSRCQFDKYIYFKMPI